MHGVSIPRLLTKGSSSYLHAVRAKNSKAPVEMVEVFSLVNIAFEPGGAPHGVIHSDCLSMRINAQQTVLKKLVFWNDQIVAHAVVAQRVKVDGSVRHGV